MHLHMLSFRFMNKAIVRIVFSSLLLLLPHTSVAQFEPASPPIADPADTRFNGVKEDWTSPALSGTNLRPARPLAAYVNHSPRYTVELLPVQCRRGVRLALHLFIQDR